MNYRDRIVKLVQINADAITPFFISTMNYGILWDNYSKTFFASNSEETSLWSHVATNVNYYFIYGSTMDSVIAGSITPMVPFVQYATEKSSAPIELRIYPCADGRFTLYEDVNDNYNYKQGAFSTLSFSWNDVKRQLTIGKRHGKFPGIPKKRILQIIIVKKDHGNGVEYTDTPDMTLLYRGDKKIMQF